MMYTRQLKEFLNELRLAKGKNCLIFAIATNPEEFVEYMESSDLRVNEIHLNGGINLLEVLSDWGKTSENTVYFVEGVRNQFPWILGYLNLHRDIFYGIKRPIVVFGSEYDITEITRYAPDLWRFRSRTYDFTEKKEMPEDFLPTSSEPSVTAEEHVHYDLPIFETEDENEIKERIKADNYLLEIVKEDHKRAELYMSLAISHLKLHDFEGGREYFDKTSKIRRKLNDDKGISIDYKRLGDFYRSEREYDKAIEYYGEAIKADPAHAAAHHNIGVLLNNLKRYDEAEEAFRRSIKIGVQLGNERGVAMALNSMGGVLQWQGRFEGAEEAWRKVIGVDSNYAEAHANLGSLFLITERSKEAKKEFVIAKKLFKDQGRVEDVKKVEELLANT